jgi:class 3 adenylate cyclase
MVRLNDLTNTVRNHLNERYSINTSAGIPTTSNISYGTTTREIEVLTFSIDLRNSTSLLIELGPEEAGKIHKSFLSVVSSIVQARGGKIRSFTGDGLLALWVSNENNLLNLIQGSMNIKWVLRNDNSPVKKLIDEHITLDFGIGIDKGTVYAMRAGIRSTNINNNDLIFMGKSINFAVNLAKEAKARKNIFISDEVYSILPEAVKYHNKNSQKIDMWETGEVNWIGQNVSIKTSSYHWTMS